MTREGILDSYTYRYDLMGNKTTLEKQRRGLPEESGSYNYGYDALGRLNTVARNGENLRTYEYDAFGNRSLLKEGNTETVYAYNAMNQLISRTDAINEEAYTYDKRGNLSLIMENGALKNSYTYGAINRLEQAVNGRGDAALYTYNGLGRRTGRESNRGREDYLIDLTRSYHNMLMMTDAEKSRIFYWDGNVSVMSESRTYEITPIFHYYLQDDLGSPLRVSGYNTGTEGKDNGYLTYGYDEFGNDLYYSLYNDMEAAGIPNPYSRQGEEQPFGYTGYRRDDISGTYFAQAREYQPQNGRFTAEDVIKGNGAFPETLNQYGYCWGNPMNLVDLNGLYPKWLYGIYAHMQFEVEFLMLYMEGFGSLACDDAYSDVNVYIPGGGIIGKYGFADMVLYAEGKAHVYEIKPISYYNDESKKKVGEVQLESYVDALKVKGYNAVNGNPEYIDFLLFWNESFYFDSDMVIKYEMFEDSPGMIYYTLIDKEELRQSAPVSQSVPYLELDEKTKQAIAIVLVMGVAALALYMTMPEKSYASCFA